MGSASGKAQDFVEEKTESALDRNNGFPLLGVQSDPHIRIPLYLPIRPSVLHKADSSLEQRLSDGAGNQSDNHIRDVPEQSDSLKGNHF